MSKNVLWDATRKKKLKNIKVVRSIVQNLNGLKVEWWEGQFAKYPARISMFWTEKIAQALTYKH
jgi:hypothetical protein